MRGRELGGHRTGLALSPVTYSVGYFTPHSFRARATSPAPKVVATKVHATAAAITSFAIISPSPL